MPSTGVADPVRPLEFEDIDQHVLLLRQRDEANGTTECRDMLTRLV